MDCPSCHISVPDKANYCMQCGCNLCVTNPTTEMLFAESERKYVTIMFSDLSGYTAMTERLDPEEVKEIMTIIFREITKIIKSYNGFIEKFIGDSVMAVFGVPRAHEDDPVRAIRAAIEMNDALRWISPKFEKNLGVQLLMHTGINSGLVVTGEVNIAKGAHGLTGDAINIASRLENIAGPGEIIVGPDTYLQAVNQFNFETMDPTTIKGKKRPVKIYKVASPKKSTMKTHRVCGLQATLVGREKEMKVLCEAVEKLRQQEGSVLSICGSAGTGKSRLKKELKDSVNGNGIKWCEGHAFSFTQNIPYYPLINLLSHVFQIDDKDSPEKVRTKVESTVTELLPDGGDYIPFIGNLFSLPYEEVKAASPEQYKDKLAESIQSVISAITNREPTIICFEDLHWADPSFIEILENILEDYYQKALFICTYRKSFTLFKDNIPENLKGHYHQIHISDLSSDDAQRMLKSLLKSNNIPAELSDYISTKIEGNPFYLEEIINSLIEFKLLYFEAPHWRLNRRLTDADIPATIHGVLLARIDRLDKNCKRILQEASAIGRAFSYKILKTITCVGNPIAPYLSELEKLDIIKTKSTKPEQIYSFKHALTHEVVYDGLLKSERRVIHQRIGFAIEHLFDKRLPEVYETLSFHFSHSSDIQKAIYYLMLSGKKSLRRHAVEEAHRYYKKAYYLIKNQKQDSNHRNALLIRTLSEWFPVYYYRGHFAAAEALMGSHLELARQIDDRELRGMFYIGYGMCLWAREKFREAYGQMHDALRTGQAINSSRVMGYAHAWLAWVCFELGLPDETLLHGKEARALAKHFDSGHYPYYHSFDSDGFAYWVIGDISRVMACSRAILKVGKETSRDRFITWGRFIMGLGQMGGGYPRRATILIRASLKTSADPLYTMFPKLFLALAAIFDGDYLSIRRPLLDITAHGRLHGCEVIGKPADLLLSLTWCIDGNMRKNVRTIQKIINDWKNSGAYWRLISGELMLAEFYLHLRLRDIRLSFLTMLRNFLFLLVVVPISAQMALRHFRHAIAIAEAIGARGMQGQAYLGMARLFLCQGLYTKAMRTVNRSLAIFQQCKARGFIKLANNLKYEIEQAQ